MPIRHAQAQWQGTLKDGAGTLKLESGAFEGPYTWADRFADGGGANPEELLGAAHAGCYSICLLYTSPSPRDRTRSRMPSSA